MTTSFNNKGTVAILFFSLGFLVFVSLVIAGKIVEKDIYVGKQALETYRGGQDFVQILLSAHIAGVQALHDAFVEQAKHGGLHDAKDCVNNGYAVWYSDSCEFAVEQVEDDFISFFNDAFPRNLNEIALENPDAAHPQAYHYRLDKQKLLIVSDEDFTYHAYNNTYTVPFVDSVSLPYGPVSDFYSRILDRIEKAAPCLLKEQGKGNNYISCLGNKTFTWQITFDEGYFFFTAKPADEKEMFEDVELRFAIALNRLDDFNLFNTEQLTF